LVLIKNQIT